jgi:hypothetical protein
LPKVATLPSLIRIIRSMVIADIESWSHLLDLPPSAFAHSCT